MTPDAVAVPSSGPPHPFFWAIVLGLMLWAVILRIMGVI